MGPRARLLGLTAAVCACALSRPAAAQEQPDTPDAPPADTIEPAPVQVTYRPPRLAVSLSFGTLGFGELQTQPVLAERLGPTGSPTDSVLLRRDLSASAGIHIGVSALLGLSPAWAARADVAYGRATLDAGYAGDDDVGPEAAAIAVTGESGIDVLLWEAALRFRIPSGRRLQPYAELGVAGVRWSSRGDDEVFPGAASIIEPATRWGPLVAIGGDVPLLPRVSARLQLSTRLLRTPFSPVGGGVPIGQGDSLALSFEDPADGRFADPSREMTHLIRLEAGLSLEVGRIRPRDPPRDESAASGSGSLR